MLSGSCFFQETSESDPVANVKINQRWLIFVLIVIAVLLAGLIGFAIYIGGNHKIATLDV